MNPSSDLKKASEIEHDPQADKRQFYVNLSQIMTEVVPQDPTKATEESAVMHLMNQIKEQTEETEQQSFAHMVDRM